MCPACLCHLEFMRELKGCREGLCTKGAGRAEGEDCSTQEGEGKGCSDPALGLMKSSRHKSGGVSPVLELGNPGCLLPNWFGGALIRLGGP